MKAAIVESMTSYYFNNLLNDIKIVIGVDNIREALKDAAVKYGTINNEYNSPIVVNIPEDQDSDNLLNSITDDLYQACYKLVNDNLESICTSCDVQDRTIGEVFDLIINNGLIDRMFMVVPAKYAFEIIC